MLEVKSTNKGMLIPRMTGAQRLAIPAPANGLMVFDTDSSAFAGFTGTGWVLFSPYASVSNRIADADGDTWIHTQTGGADGDSLVFHLGDAGGTGTTEMVLVKNFSNIARLELPDERENTFVGQHSGEHTGQGYYNVGLGANALHANIAGWGNTALGSNALRLNTSGEYNTAVGREALHNNKLGKGNVAIGTGALYKADWNFTVAVGDSALFNFFNDAPGVTAVGSKAGFSNATGSYNTFIGAEAGYATNSGAYNTFLGFQSGHSNTIGTYNTFLGQSAGFTNTVGKDNTAVGSEALLVNTTGERNTAVGRQAMLSNAIGVQNTALGWHALHSNTGSNNTGVGSSALASMIFC